MYSAFRLVEAARGAGARVLIVNVGPTRADKLADFKVGRGVLWEAGGVDGLGPGRGARSCAVSQSRWYAEVLCRRGRVGGDCRRGGVGREVRAGR